MPCYGLAGTIAANIDRVVAATSAEAGVEVVVADDGSTDGTRQKPPSGPPPGTRTCWSWPTRRTPARAGCCSGPSPRRAARSWCSSTATWTSPRNRSRPWSRSCAAAAGMPCSGPSGPPWSPGATPGPGACCPGSSPPSPDWRSACPWRRPRRASRPSAGSRWRRPCRPVQIGRYSFDLELVSLLHRAGRRIGEYPVRAGGARLSEPRHRRDALGDGARHRPAVVPHLRPPPALRRARRASDRRKTRSR